MSAFGTSILQLWTRDEAAARAGGPVIELLALGTAVHAMMFIPYALKLACGAARLALNIGMAVLALSLPAIVLGALSGGGRGAAAAWLGIAVLYLLAGSAVTHARLLPGVTGTWLLRDVAPPAAISLLLAAAASWATDLAAWDAAARVAAAVAVVVACWALMAMGSTRLRQALAAMLVRPPAS
jgi:O-antigen/teichoic acid export membrane protein